MCLRCPNKIILYIFAIPLQRKTGRLVSNQLKSCRKFSLSDNKSNSPWKYLHKWYTFAAIHTKLCGPICGTSR